MKKLRALVLVLVLLTTTIKKVNAVEYSELENSFQTNHNVVNSISKGVEYLEQDDFIVNESNNSEEVDSDIEDNTDDITYRNRYIHIGGIDLRSDWRNEYAVITIVGSTGKGGPASMQGYIGTYKLDGVTPVSGDVWFQGYNGRIVESLKIYETLWVGSEEEVIIKLKQVTGVTKGGETYSIQDVSEKHSRR